MTGVIIVHKGEDRLFGAAVLDVELITDLDLVLQLTYLQIKPVPSPRDVLTPLVPLLRVCT